MVRCVCAALVGLGLAGAAAADDGVIEINSARVIAGGITTGDTAGYPATISEPGSYRLTGDIGRQGSGNIIEITSDDVTLDLNGFTVSCQSSPITFCTSGIGIDANGHANVSIVNGTVRGVADRGILTGSHALKRDVRVMDIASGDPGVGIHTGANSMITGNIVTGCQGAGLFAASGSMIVSNTFSSNGTGIEVIQAGSIIQGNSVFGNTGTGISAGSGSVANVAIVGNTVTGNGFDGIHGGELISDNLVRGNGACGIRMIDGAVWGGNVLSFNSVNPSNLQVLKNSTNVEISTNVCSRTTVCGTRPGAGSCP